MSGFDPYETWAKKPTAHALSSLRISWVWRPTVEWKDTDYEVVGDGVPVRRISTMSGANFSLD
jgi:hypothetical protein